MFKQYIATLILLLPVVVWANPPDWEVSNITSYDYTATAVVQVVLDELPSNDAADRIAFLVDGEVRGVGQPVSLGGPVYHFVTLYSNIALGEEMQILVYQAAADQVYMAETTISFQYQGVYGTVNEPLLVNAFSDGDVPISLGTVNSLTTMQGIPFAPIDMSAALLQTDNDAIFWSADPNPHLQAAFNSSQLQVTVSDPNWFGSTSLTVRATEQTNNAYSAATSIVFTVEERYSAPQWTEIPRQENIPGNTFSLLDLNNFEIAFGGNCINYGIGPVLETPNPALPSPNWSVATVGDFTTNVTAHAYYTPAFPFDQPEDVLSFWIDGELRGVMAPRFFEGRAYFIGNVTHSAPQAEMEVRVYSSQVQDVYTLPITLPFGGDGSIGNVNEPLVLDFSPFQFAIDGDGQLQTSTQEPDYIGYGSYELIAADCAYPQELNDLTETDFCQDVDTDGDGWCDILDPAPEDRCIPDELPPTLLIHNENTEGVTTGGMATHNADPGDCLKTLEWYITAYELCDVPEIDVQISCEEAYVLPGASVEMVDQNPDEFTFRLRLQAAVGINELHLTATDAEGNSSFFEYTIEVSDTQPPNIVCQPATVLLTPDGEGTLPAEAVFDMALSQDNCGIEALDVNIQEFNCNDLGSNTVMLTATDRAGNMSNCSATVQVAQSGELPSEWSAADIGNVTVGNDYFFDPCTAPATDEGTFLITGSGNNASSSTTDHVAFASVSICGDGSVTAKIESVSGNGYGGVMIRESSDAGSRQVALFSNLSSVLRHEARYTPNSPKQVNSFFKPSPFWLRLERSGSWIFTYYSTTGTNFQYVHGVFMPMQECTEIGLASFTYLPNAQTEAVFSNVSLSGTNSGIAIDEGGGYVINRMPHTPTLFPNPANSTVNLVFNAPIALEAIVILRNQLGQIIQQRQLQPGDEYTEWDVSTFSDGVYFMEIRRAGQQPEVLRLVKAR